MVAKSNLSLCKTIGKLSRQVWRDMGDSCLENLSLSEESITDYFILNLTRLHPQGVLSWKFNHWEESHLTGADWEWWIGSSSGWYGLLIQAKRLYISPKTLLETYESLSHYIGKTSRLQVDLLIEDAKRRDLYPIYCFYNFLRNPPVKPITCSNAKSDKRSWGCTVASAHVIKGFISNKKISADEILPISRILTCLFCPSSLEDVDGVSQRVKKQCEAMQEPMELKPDIPKIRTEPPEYVKTLLRGGSLSSDDVEKFRLQYTRILITDTQNEER